MSIISFIARSFHCFNRYYGDDRTLSNDFNNSSWIDSTAANGARLIFMTHHQNQLCTLYGNEKSNSHFSSIFRQFSAHKISIKIDYWTMAISIFHWITARIIIIIAVVRNWFEINVNGNRWKVFASQERVRKLILIGYYTVDSNNNNLYIHLVCDCS